MESRAGTDGDRIGKRWGFLLFVAAVQTVMSLGTTVVMVSLPDLRHAFDLSVSELQWVVTSYNLCFGGLLLAGGRLADVLGRRRVLGVGLLIVAVGSLLAGLAVNAVMLALMRGLQGLGAALASPSALSLLTSVFTGRRSRSVALGVWAACGATGAALGNVVGGLVTASVGWRWIFLLNLPVCVLLLGLLATVVPRRQQVTKRRSLKLGSAALITGALVLVIFGLSELPQRGIGSPVVLTSTLVACILGSVFFRVQVRTADPMLNVTLLRGASGIGYLLILLASSVNSGPYYVASIFMQEVLHLSSWTAGLLFLVWCVMTASGSQLASRAIPRIGARRMLVLGFTASFTGMAVLASNASDNMGSGVLIAAFLLVGTGSGFVGVSATTVALAGIPPEHSGVGSGVANGSQQLGGAISIAVLALMVALHAGPDGAPDALAVRMGLWCAAGIAALGLFTAAFFAPGDLLRRRMRGRP